jgi:hypothetical protein
MCVSLLSFLVFSLKISPVIKHVRYNPMYIHIDKGTIAYTNYLSSVKCTLVSDFVPIIIRMLRSNLNQWCLFPLPIHSPFPAPNVQLRAQHDGHTLLTSTQLQSRAWRHLRGVSGRPWWFWGHRIRGKQPATTWSSLFFFWYPLVN